MKIKGNLYCLLDPTLSLNADSRQTMSQEWADTSVYQWAWNGLNGLFVGIWIDIFISFSDDGMSKIFHCTAFKMSSSEIIRVIFHALVFFFTFAHLLCYLNVRAKWHWLNHPHPIDMQPNRSLDVASPFRAALIHINFMDNRWTHPKHLMQLNSKINCNISIAEPHKNPLNSTINQEMDESGKWPRREGARWRDEIENKTTNGRWKICINYFRSKLTNLLLYVHMHTHKHIHLTQCDDNDGDARGDNEWIELRCYHLNIVFHFSLATDSFYTWNVDVIFFCALHSQCRK